MVIAAAVVAMPTRHQRIRWDPLRLRVGEHLERFLTCLNSVQNDQRHRGKEKHGHCRLALRPFRQAGQNEAKVGLYHHRFQKAEEVEVDWQSR